MTDHKSLKNRQKWLDETHPDPPRRFCPLAALALLVSLALAPAPAMAGDQFVSVTADSGLGSLRQAILNINAQGSGTITFDPLISGDTITLTSGQLTIDGDMTIDASGLPGGITIDAGGNSRIFIVQFYRTVVLESLVITGGDAGVYAPTSGNGGAIVNAGHLTIRNSTITGNRSHPFAGGAILNL